MNYKLVTTKMTLSFLVLCSKPFFIHKLLFLDNRNMEVQNPMNFDNKNTFLKLIFQIRTFNTRKAFICNCFARKKGDGVQKSETDRTKFEITLFEIILELLDIGIHFEQRRFQSYFSSNFVIANFYHLPGKK